MPVKQRSVCSLEARSHSAFFFLIASAIHLVANKWVAQESMEVFTLYDCDNITNFYEPIERKKTNRSRNQKKLHCVNKP